MPVAVSGLQPENTATNAALHRLTEFSGRGGTARMPSTGASVAGPKSTVSVPTSTGPNVAKAVGMVKSAYHGRRRSTTGPVQGDLGSRGRRRGDDSGA
jgi:hypothetical protein